MKGPDCNMAAHYTLSFFTSFKICLHCVFCHSHIVLRIVFFNLLLLLILFLKSEWCLVGIHSKAVCFGEK